MPPHFHDLIGRLGPTIASLFFDDGAAENAGRVGFLRGFNRCCARIPVSQSLAFLLRVYAADCTGAGAPCAVQFHPDEDGGGGDEGKVVGELAPGEIAVLLWMCWVIAWSGSAPRVSGEEGGKGEPVVLPNVVLRGMDVCAPGGSTARINHRLAEKEIALVLSSASLPRCGSSRRRPGCPRRTSRECCGGARACSCPPWRPVSGRRSTSSGRSASPTCPAVPTYSDPLRPVNWEWQALE